MDTLRNEILESQKVRSDLLKWKLIIISALGAAGLGLSGSFDTINASLVLCIIPFACAYVDLLCRHLSLRNKAIGIFLSKQESVKSDDNLVFQYELFYNSIADKVWKKESFESFAVYWASIFITILSTIVGIFSSGFLLSDGFHGLLQYPTLTFIISGLLGLILLKTIEVIYQKWKREIELK